MSVWENDSIEEPLRGRPSIALVDYALIQTELPVAVQLAPTQTIACLSVSGFRQPGNYSVCRFNSWIVAFVAVFLEEVEAERSHFGQLSA